jgi:hypothetical protein
LEKAHAPIPAQNRIIVSGRADVFGLCERLQSLFEQC